MLPNFRFVAPPAAVLALLACAAAASAGDFVQMRNGTFQPATKNIPPQASDFEASNWTVIDADSEFVKYQFPINKEGKLATQTIKAAEVLEIWIDKSKVPSGWKDAADALEAGDAAKAAALFKAIGDDKSRNSVLRQKALLNAAHAKGAEDGYQYLLQSFPASFYSRVLWRDLANLFMDRGDMDKAADAIKKLLALGATDADKQEARFLQNTIAFRKAVAAKDAAAIQKCLDDYRAIARETAGNKDLASVSALARLGTGNCLLELGNFKEAKGIFEELKAGDDDALLASAYNGLGECWYKQGGTEGFFEARLCFLRTVTMYASGAAPEQVAKALFYAGDCFALLQDSEDWRDRARKELDQCVNRFPKSAWAEKAKNRRTNLPAR